MSRSESFGPIGFSNGKVLLNGPYANIFNDIGITFFGIIIIAAIFGTSILRDFQRDIIQILFTKPISKFAYLGGRWAGSFVATVFAFFGLLPRRDGWARSLPGPTTRASRPTTFRWYLAAVLLHRCLSDLLPRLSLFPGGRAFARRSSSSICRARPFFMLYLIGLAIFNATRSPEHFWPGIFDPVGLLFNDAITRYWTVVDNNTLLFSWSPHAAQRSLPL